MANINIFSPDSGVTKTISVTIEASMIVQDLLGDIEFFISISTVAKDVMGKPIAKRQIRTLSDGAGGEGVDRHGNALDAGQYVSLTAAIDDYVAVMVDGVENEPWTEMAFT